MTTIPRQAVVEFLRSLGFDENRVCEVHLYPREVEVVQYVVDAEDRLVLDDSGDNVKHMTATFAVVDQ